MLMFDNSGDSGELWVQQYLVFLFCTSDKLAVLKEISVLARNHYPRGNTTSFMINFETFGYRLQVLSCHSFKSVLPVTSPEELLLTLILTKWK